MLVNVLEAIKGTPWWVFALFMYLMLQGTKALKYRVIPVRKIFVIPSIFLLWSLYTLATFKMGDIFDFAIWAIATSFGAMLGWMLTRSIPIKADKKKALIALPGGVMTIVLSLLIFAVKYFFGFYYATHPNAFTDPVIHGADLLTTGVIIGLFLGRACCYLKKFSATEHTELA
jgi:hypothetical protein